MKISFSNYLPLIYVYIFTVFVSYILSKFYVLSNNEVLKIFLGIFLFVFSLLKIIKLKDFVDAFSEYDLITQRIRLYGYFFPFLELIFSFSFLLLMENIFIEMLCLILFILNTFSVFQALKKKRRFICACLGNLVKLPLSYVSLLENLTIIIGIVYIIFS